MTSLFRFRTLACVACLTMPACVVKLVDRNSPEPNGAVTGGPGDCSDTGGLGLGGPGGDAAPKFVGRFAVPLTENPDVPSTSRIFDWSGSYITVRFSGTTRLTVRLSLLGATPQDQMFAFAVDGGEPVIRQITVKVDASGKATNEPLDTYDIDGLTPGEHEVTIYKNTEAQKGSVEFKGFELNGGTLLPPTRRARRIEFIGDSIICGYGNEGKNATCPFEVKVRDAVTPEGKSVPVTVPVTENQYKSFTSIAARELGADAVTICWSGKGAYKNYKERFIPDANGQLVPEPDTKTTVPELWNTRTLATDYEGYRWDWSKENPDEIPQVVFISLGTNDFSRDTLPVSTDPNKLSGDNQPDGDMDVPAELEQFFAKYLDLVRMVRQHRPKAHIFLATPPMVTDQFPLDNARKTLRGVLDRITAEMVRSGDYRVYAMNMVEQGFRYGLGCDYHPNLEVHRIMAKQLVGAVKLKTCW